MMIQIVVINSVSCHCSIQVPNLELLSFFLVTKCQYDIDWDITMLLKFFVANFTSNQKSDYIVAVIFQRVPEKEKQLCLTMENKMYEISFYAMCNAEYYCCCIYFHQFGNFTLYCWLCISKICRAIISIQSIRPNMSLFHTDHNKSLYLSL